MYVIKINAEHWYNGQNLQGEYVCALKKGSEFKFVFNDDYQVIPATNVEVVALYPMQKIFQ